MDEFATAEISPGATGIFVRSRGPAPPVLLLHGFWQTYLMFVPVRILRAAQFHEFVGPIVEWGRQDGVSYVSKMRTQLVAARTVAQALAELATGPESASAPRSSGTSIPEIAGPTFKEWLDSTS